MRYVIFFFIIQFTALTSNEQDLNLGEVRYDTAFNCSSGQYRFFSDKIFTVPDLCDSKNDLEVRLKMIFLPHGNRELIILSNKEGKWDAKKYILSGGSLGQKLTTISYILPDWDTIAIKQTCTYILNHLIENKVFLLPDQSELKHDPCCLDGVLIRLSYKTEKLFRGYSYDNPDAYIEHYPDSKEYIYIKEIAKTLRQLF